MLQRSALGTFKILVLCLFVLTVVHARAQGANPFDAPAATAPTTPGCADAKKLRLLCANVYLWDAADDDAPAGYKYRYQTKILAASCADPAVDSKAVIAQKVSRMWDQLPKQLSCTLMQFDVEQGSVLKLAALGGFDAFIYDAIRWKVNLNRIDASDQRTLLDYVRDQAEKNKGNALESKFRSYYKMLRDAGAKHKSEL